MAHPIETVSLPALAGIEPGTNRIEIVRPLSPDDLSALDGARNLYSVASPIMTMFGVLYWNYSDLTQFTEALAQGQSGPPPAALTANRLILNYTAAADALLEHFAGIYKRQCRIKKMPDGGFEELRSYLEETDDDFEFFSHFRNYVLHAGLPVGILTVSGCAGGARSFDITHRSQDLKEADTRGQLGSCRLLDKHETVDLLHHLDRFHDLMMSRVFREVVNCFMADMKEAHALHEQLTKEVTLLGQELRPHMMTGRATDGPGFKWTFKSLPMNLIAELGIQLKQTDSTTAGEAE